MILVATITHPTVFGYYGSTSVATERCATVVHHAFIIVRGAERINP